MSINPFTDRTGMFVEPPSALPPGTVVVVVVVVVVGVELAAAKTVPVRSSRLGVEEAETGSSLQLPLSVTGEHVSH
jgi:hypothetical protein